MKLLQGALILGVVLAPVGGLVLWKRLDRAVPGPRQGAWNRPLAERMADPFPRTYQNAMGEKVEVAKPAERIVSATIFSDAVLLEVAPADRLLALHRISQDPLYSPVSEASRRFPRHVSGDAEEILALRPDLVIVSGFSRKETRNLLSRDGCAVLRFLGFSSIADVQNNIRALGYVLGLDQPAEDLVIRMQTELDRVAEQRQARVHWRVLHYAGGRTSGRSTTFDSLLEYVGAHNVGRDLGLEGSVAIQPEQVLIADPDVLVVGIEPGGEQHMRDALRQMPGFATLAAVRRDRLLFLSDALLMSTSHHLAKAATRIASVLDQWERP